MEYYNTINDSYLDRSKRPSAVRELRVQALDHWENAVSELTGSINTSNPPTVSIGLQNGLRRSGSFVLDDPDGEFSPGRDSDIWYNRKVRIISRISDEGTGYSFSEGVFVVKSAQPQENRILVQLCDKFGMLNGETGTGRAGTAFTTKIADGTIYVAALIRELLARPLGNGLPIDPTPPIIDPYFERTALYHDITLSAGQYYGDVLTQLADMYGADVYYDRDGRLNFIRRATYSMPSWYEHTGYVYTFEEGDILEDRGATELWQFDGINIVTVCAETAEGVIVSRTVKNTNPRSPLDINSVGERWGDEPITYISAGAGGDTEEKCRQYGEYILLKNTRNTVTEELTVLYMPHFDVDQVVRRHDEDYLIQSIDTDLSACTSRIRLVNTQFLPDNIQMEV